MKSLLITSLTLMAISSVSLAQEQLATPGDEDQYQDSGIALCMDPGVCFGAQIQVPKQQAVLNRAERLQNCLINTANELLGGLDNSNLIKAESQISSVENTVYSICRPEKNAAEQEGMDRNQLSNIQLNVHNQLVNYWLKSRGA